MAKKSILVPAVTWKQIKDLGSAHYKQGEKVEPIDLYRDGGILRDFAVGNAAKYAYRNRSETQKPVSKSDAIKIIHYGYMLLYLANKEETCGK